LAVKTSTASLLLSGDVFATDGRPICHPTTVDSPTALRPCRQYIEVRAGRRGCRAQWSVHHAQRIVISACAASWALTGQSMLRRAI